MLLTLQACQTAYDDAKAQLDEAQTAFNELKATFAEDPTALTSWMNALFDIADAGVTTFTVGGPAWPYTAPEAANGRKDGGEAVEGVERMLAAFQKRYAAERGAGTTQVCTFRATQFARLHASWALLCSSDSALHCV